MSSGMVMKFLSLLFTFVFVFVGLHLFGQVSVLRVNAASAGVVMTFPIPLPKPTKLTLSTAGMATWAGGSAALGSYKVQLYKDGKSVVTKTLSASTKSYDFASYFTSTAAYKLDVTALPRSGPYVKSPVASITVTGGPSVVVTPAAIAVTPAAIAVTPAAVTVTPAPPDVLGILINDSGMATWTDVATEINYTLELKKNGISEAAVTVPANTTSYDFGSYFRSPYFGDYTLIVTAIGVGGLPINGPTAFNQTVQPNIITEAVRDPIAKTYTVTDVQGTAELIISGEIVKKATDEEFSLILDNDVARMRIPVGVMTNDISLTTGQHLYVKMAKLDDLAILNMIKNNDSNIISVKAFVEFEMGVVSGVLIPRRIYNFCTPLEIDIKNVTQINTFHQAAVYHILPQYDNNGGLTSVDVNYSGGRAFPAKKEIKYYTDHFSYYIVMERKQTFSDIKTSWAQGAIELMAARKILAGYDSSFFPKVEMKRVDFSVVVNKSLGKKPEVFKAVFNDLHENDYYSGHILSLNTYSILDINTGTIQNPSQFGVYEDNSNVFRSITREQAATFIVNAYKYVKGYKDYLPAIIGPIPEYSDLNSASNIIMQKNIIDITKIGIMRGYPDGTFAPNRVLTREETAQILSLFLTKIDEISRFWDYAPDVG